MSAPLGASGLRRRSRPTATCTSTRATGSSATTPPASASPAPTPAPRCSAARRHRDRTRRANALREHRHPRAPSGGLLGARPRRRSAHRQPGDRPRRSTTPQPSHADFQVTPERARRGLHLDVPLTGYTTSATPRSSATTRATDTSTAPPAPDQRAGDQRRAAGRRRPQPDRRRPRLLHHHASRSHSATLDNKQDAYEWEPAARSSLISTGIGQFDSGLLSAGADGRDAYFFTRDSAGPEDDNGQRGEDLRRPRRRRLPVRVAAQRLQGLGRVPRRRGRWRRARRRSTSRPAPSGNPREARQLQEAPLQAKGRSRSTASA